VGRTNLAVAPIPDGEHGLSEKIHMASWGEFMRFRRENPQGSFEKIRKASWRKSRRFLGEIP
jgi:hypothetical protein